MTLINRFNTNDCGAITFTGNTLGLSKRTNSSDAGTIGAIGAFITLDTNLQVPTYPVIPNAGTTLYYNLNESAAILNIPKNSKILYAELIWGGQFVSRNGKQDFTNVINDPVKFTTSEGDTFEITPDKVTAFEIKSNKQRRWYVRTANVTQIIKAAGEGIYSCGSVVATTDPMDNRSNFAGWTLAVAYSSDNLPLRNIQIFAGEITVTGALQGTLNVTGFTTPSINPPTGRILVSAMDTDAESIGNQVLFGPNLGNLTALQGPNNMVNNFFACQINSNNGFLDTSGTYGTINHEPGTNTVAGRQSWDITNVDASPTLMNSQTGGVFRFQPGGDSFSVNTLGIQIDLEPEIQITKLVDRNNAELGSLLAYAIKIENNGNIDIRDVIFTDEISNGIEFIHGTLAVNGILKEGANPVIGVELGEIDANTEVCLNYSVRITEDESICGSSINNSASLNYSYGCRQSNTIDSNLPVVNVQCVQLDAVKTADTDIAIVGEIITYAVEITNSGTVDVINVIFQEKLNNKVTFIPNTFRLNNNIIPNANLVNGVNIGNIVVGETSIVKYTVSFDRVTCPLVLTNQANINFEFRLSSNQPIQTREITSNRVTLDIGPISFKEIDLDGTERLPCEKPDIDKIINSLSEIDIINTRLIETIKSKAVGGQILTGNKLIIEGKLNYKIEYIPKNCSQAVHSAHFTNLFSSFVVLPKNFVPGTEVSVKPIIEDIYTKLLDGRTIYRNIICQLKVIYRE